MNTETLSFEVHKNENETTAPRWKEVKVENADCPRCGEVMVVVLGNQGILYAYCLKCVKYYLAG
jgi:ssDNA-binding Zn-finger/Zn-ribbon topoisomerase 1